MKKTFSLLTLLLLLCTSAWGTTWVLTADNDATADSKSTWTIDGVTFSFDKTHAGDAWTLSDENKYFKLSANKTYTLSIPASVTISNINIKGYTNDNSNTNCVSTIGSVDVSSTSFPQKASNAGIQTTANCDAAISQTGGTVAIVIPSGKQLAVIITVTGTLATTYSVTYALNGGTGTTPTESAKAAGAKFTLHNGTSGISAPSISKVFAGWNDGTSTYAGGAEYTMPANNVTLTAQWSDIYTVTYQSGEGTGDNVVVSPATIVADCPNTFTAPDGKRFAGWKDAEDHDIAVGATVTSDLTLTAQWEVIPVCYSFAPTKTEGTLSANEIVATSTGGVMQVVSGSTIKYTEYGLSFESSGNTKANVILKNNMKVGTTITATVWSNNTGSARALKLNNSSGTTKATWSFTPASVEGEEEVFTYTVEAGDGLAGSNQFQLQRGSNIYLESLVVKNGGDEYAEPVMLKADTWASFCPSFDVTIPAVATSNVSVNYATFNSATNVLTTHKLNESGDVKIKAGEGVLLKASADGLKQFLATTGAVKIAENVLGGTTERTLTSTLKDGEEYLMALNGSTNAFVSYTGDYFPANKAYFAVTPAGSAPSGIRIVDEESNATSLSDIESTDEGVKFIQNGQLFIKKNGVVYDMLGIVVRK